MFDKYEKLFGNVSKNINKNDSKNFFKNLQNNLIDNSCQVIDVALLEDCPTNPKKITNQVHSKTKKRHWHWQLLKLL